MIEKVRIINLVDDSVDMEHPNILAKHGLALFIEIDFNEKEKINILMDTGPSPDIILHNAKELNIDLKKINIIVISHAHYDHTGGLIEILKQINKRILIIMHPNCLDLKFAEKPYLRYIGIPFKISEIEEAGGILLLSRKPVKITPEIIVSGEIERINEYEKVEDFLTLKNYEIIKDNLLEDQALFLKINNKGLLIITGCAHSGIINTIEYAKKITGLNKIYAILGGLHLINANEERLKVTINEIEKINPEKIFPCHCTGQKAIIEFIKNFKNKCIPIQAGQSIEL
ncbi:MAG: MBL fold metallo-hydrolase [Nitrososphaerota archaeon]